jgi:2,5-diamino-6-(ribosylamino)-4(3H)-pyrimidinone 5'-phosphate reductase
VFGNGESCQDNKVNPLSTHLQQKLEEIQRVLECLIEESLRGTPMIVEGKKDVLVLRELGVTGKIFSAKTAGKSRLDVMLEIEQSGHREIILLLDFDRRGKEWTEKLRQDLERTKIKPNLTFWNRLFGIAGKELKDVEGLVAYLQTLTKKAR